MDDIIKDLIPQYIESFLYKISKILDNFNPSTSKVDLQFYIIISSSSRDMEVRIMDGMELVKYNKEKISIISNLKQILEGILFHFPHLRSSNQFSSDKFPYLAQPSLILAITSEFPSPNSSFLNIPPKFESHMIQYSDLMILIP
jgi:hypothetical protein